MVEIKKKGEKEMSGRTIEAASVNLRSPSPAVDGVYDSTYAFSSLLTDGQPEIGRGLPSIDDERKAGEANRTTQKTLERVSGGMPG